MLQYFEVLIVYLYSIKAYVKERKAAINGRFHDIIYMFINIMVGISEEVSG
jgi:hypothetical protein